MHKYTSVEIHESVHLKQKTIIQRFFYHNGMNMYVQMYYSVLYNDYNSYFKIQSRSIQLKKAEIPEF